jgi:hypothetical protein
LSILKPRTGAEDDRDAKRNHFRPSYVLSIWSATNQSNPRAGCARGSRRAPGMARATRPVADGGAAGSRRAARRRVFDTGQARSAVALLVLAWLPIVAWHEHVAFRATSASCAWPELEGTTSASPDARVAVIADPQVTDFTSYRSFAPKGSWTLAAIERVSDAYQHRAFRLAVLPKRPERVLFLGDLLDGGWLTADDETFDATARRFERIFRWPGRDETRSSDSPSSERDEHPKTHMSVHGNHDVGYASRAESFPEIRKRHESRFGVSNYVERVGGVDVVGVNAMALDGDPRSEAAKETWAFVDALSVQQNVSSRNRPPRVLVTHLPLPKASYAPGSCGESRFGPVIQPRTRRTRRGVEYQDYLSDGSARRLLRATRPSLVLAGHDHDRCVASHEISGAVFRARGDGDGDGDGDATGRDGDATDHAGVTVSVTEITLGTFSWLMGNPKPSFALMTLRGEVPSAAAEGTAKYVDTAICELPEHLAGVWSYAYLGGFSAFVLLVWPSLRVAAAFMRSGDVEAFARRAGIDPKANRRVASGARRNLDSVATWTRVVAAALWRHCGPFFVALALVLGGIAGGTLWDLSRP